MNKNNLGFNQFDLEINFSAIRKDFIILKITKDENWLTYQELGQIDILLTSVECKAVAISFTGGSQAYVLYKRHEFGNRLPQSVLEEFDEELDVRVEVAEVEDLQNYKLYQLFLSACTNSENLRHRYNNLNGGLFITFPHADFHNKRDNSRIALEVKVGYQNTLKLETVTFTCVSRYKDLILGDNGNVNPKRKRKFHESTRFIYDTKNATFRRCLNEEQHKAKDLYIRMRPKERFRKGARKKHQIPFLLLDPKRYPATKIGMIATLLLENFEKRFNKYFQVRQRIITGEITKKYSERKTIFAPLETVPICIVDNVKNNKIAQDIIDFYKKEYSLSLNVVSSIQANAINLLFNHDKQFYSLNKKLKDPYQKSNLNCSIQNFTLQEYEPNGKNQLFKTLLEAHIKYDIAQKKLSIFNWAELKMENDWYFAIGEFIKEPKDLIFHFLKITPNGSLEFSSFNQTSLTGNLYNRIASIFRNNLDKKGKPKIEGVLFNGKGSYNILLETPLKTMPELSSLHFRLMKGANLEDETLSRPELLHFTKDFIARNGSNTQIDGAYSFLKNSKEEMIDLPSFQSFFGGKGAKKLSINFTNEFWEEFGYWLKQLAKNKYATAETFGSMVDLHAIRKGKEMLFWANKAMGKTQGKFLKTNVIRSLRPYNNSLLLFNNLLDMMAVDFVRVGAPSVIPFPFKFLREYRNMVETNDSREVILNEFDFNT